MNPLADTAVGRWYARKRGFVAFVVVVVLAGVGIWRVETIARNAADQAERVEEQADRIEEQAAELEEARAQNAGLICSIGELLTAIPITPLPGQSPREFQQRVRSIRRFVADLRLLEDCEPPEVRTPDRALREGRRRPEPFRLRLTPEARQALETARGGDSEPPGQPPGGLGGRLPPPLDEAVTPLCETAPSLCEAAEPLVPDLSP